MGNNAEETRGVGWLALANAVTVQAVRDYRRYTIRIKKLNTRKKKTKRIESEIYRCEYEISQIEQYFMKSKICMMDGDVLLSEMRRIFDDD